MTNYVVDVEDIGVIVRNNLPICIDEEEEQA